MVSDPLSPVLRTRGREAGAPRVAVESAPGRINDVSPTGVARRFEAQAPRDQPSVAFDELGSLGGLGRLSGREVGEKLL